MLELESPEQTPEDEKGKIETNIHLHFMRHGKKEKEPKNNDIAIRLTPHGKLQALCRAIEMGEKKMALAKGSLRERAQETAGIAALSSNILKELGVNQEKLIQLRDNLAQGKKLDTDEQTLLDKVGEIMSLENLENKYAALFNSKDIRWIEQDARLDFSSQGSIGQEIEDAYTEGNLMEYMIKQSDRRAIATQDSQSTTYTKEAAAVADIILGYAETSQELNSLVTEHSERYEEIKQDDKTYVFNRFFGSHASVGESFVLKVVEALENKGKLKNGSQEKMLGKLGSSFQETEGFEITIRQTGKNQKIVLSLPERIASQDTQQILIDADILKQIVQQGEELQTQITGR